MSHTSIRAPVKMRTCDGYQPPAAEYNVPSTIVHIPRDVHSHQHFHPEVGYTLVLVYACYQPSRRPSLLT